MDEPRQFTFSQLLFNVWICCLTWPLLHVFVEHLTYPFTSLPPSLQGTPSGLYPAPISLPMLLLTKGILIPSALGCMNPDDIPFPPQMIRWPQDSPSVLPVALATPSQRNPVPSWLPTDSKTLYQQGLEVLTTSDALHNANPAHWLPAYCAHALHNFSEERLSILTNPNTLASFNAEVIDPLLNSDTSKAQEHLQGLLATADAGFTPVLRHRPVPLTDGPPNDESIVCLNIASPQPWQLRWEGVKLQPLASCNKPAIADVLANSTLPGPQADTLLLVDIPSTRGSHTWTLTLNGLLGTHNAPIPPFHFHSAWQHSNKPMWTNPDRYGSSSTPAPPTYLSISVSTVGKDLLNVQANARLAAHLREEPAPHILEEDAEPTEDLAGDDFHIFARNHYSLSRAARAYWLEYQRAP